MKLELKHLAPYLPYKLAVLSDELVPGKLYEMLVANHTVSFNGGLTISDVLLQRAKPVLRPIEDAFAVLDEIKHRYNEENETPISDVKFHNIGGFTLFATETDDSYEVSMPLWAYELMFENHIDVFDLIPAGLAVSRSEVAV